MERLIERIKNGDIAASEVLVKRYQGMAIGYAYSLTGNSHAAEDIAQEAFVQVFMDIGKLECPRAFAGWFRKIIFTKWTRHLRQKLPPMEVYDEDSNSSAEGREPADPAIEGERREQVLRLVDALPGKERTVISLFYLSGYRMKEIGDLLSIPISTVKSRLYTARLKMQRKFQEMTGAGAREARLGGFPDSIASVGSPEGKEPVNTAMAEGIQESDIGKIAKENYHLVADMAGEYAGDGGVQLTDLMQAGHMGLMVAIEKYHPSCGHEFVPYATWWIRQAVTRANANWWIQRAEAKPIEARTHEYETFSTRTVEKIQEIIRTYRSLVRDFGRGPSTEEIVEKMKVPLDGLREVLEMASANRA